MSNILYFDRKGATNNIWYYEVNPPYKLTKNKPIAYEHLAEFVDLFHNPEKRNATNAKTEKEGNDWTINIADIKDYDLSAKNPHKIVEVVHQSPKELLTSIKQNDAQIAQLLTQIEIMYVMYHNVQCVCGLIISLVVLSYNVQCTYIHTYVVRVYFLHMSYVLVRVD